MLCIRVLYIFTSFFVISAATFADEKPDTVFVPMRDGTELATDIYLPEGEGPWPCILS